MIIDKLKESRNKPKLPNNLPTFSGKTNEHIDSLIFIFENNFNTYKIEENDKVMIIGNFLRELALSTY